MLKFSFAFFGVLFTIQICGAHTRFINHRTPSDTAIYLLKNSGELVKSADSADYVMFILPHAASDKNQLNQVFEYYKNGKIKFTGMTRGQFVALTLQGSCMSFFANGRRKSVFNYEDGRPVGDAICYYPNGKVYTLTKYMAKIQQPQLVECHDSTGVATAENGNGKWLVFDDTFSNLVQEGPIKDGIEDGIWTQMIAGQKLDFAYTKGIITKPIDYNLSGDVVAKPEIPATTSAKIGNIENFMARAIRYPAVDRESNTQGEVIVSFIVEIDGSISNFKSIKSISKTINQELERVLKLTAPWVPAKNNSRLVRSKITLPVTFKLEHVDARTENAFVIVGKMY